MNALDKFAAEKDAVDRLMDGTLQGEPKRLYDASRHIPLAGGKRIRPLMCMLSCEAAGGARMDALRTATAIELVHTFTLIHDDIMDNDDLRRGKPSVHVVYGMPTAILAGDILYSKAFEICDPRTSGVLARASSEVCEGQELDMSFEERADVSEDEYLVMIRKKTAVLLEASMRAGAIIAGAPADVVDSLSSLGLNLGMAFQIQDDILGLTADEKKLGKPVGSDIVEGKKNLIIIKALESLGDADREDLRSFAGGGSGRPVSEAIDLIRDSGAIDYCREKADSYVGAAMAALGGLPVSPAREDLCSVAEYIVKRDL